MLWAELNEFRPDVHTPFGAVGLVLRAGTLTLTLMGPRCVTPHLRVGLTRTYRLRCDMRSGGDGGDGAGYAYTQMSHYIACPQANPINTCKALTVPTGPVIHPSPPTVV